MSILITRGVANAMPLFATLKKYSFFMKNFAKTVDKLIRKRYNIYYNAVIMCNYAVKLYFTNGETVWIT